MKHTAKLTLLAASITAILSAPAMATSADDIGGINLKLDQTNQRIEGVNNNANLGINTVSSHLKVTNAQVASNQHLLNSVENGVKSNTNNIYHLEQQIHANESAIYSQMDDNKAASNQLTMHALQVSAQNRQDNADQQKTIDENHTRLSNQEMTINDQSGRIHTAEQDSQHALGAIATMDKSITAINDHTAKAEASIQAFASRTTDSIKANTQIGLDAQVAAANAQSSASKNSSDIAINVKDIEGNTQIGLDAQVAAANAQSSASKNSSDIAINAKDIKDNTQIGLDAQVAAANAQSSASKNSNDIAINAKGTAQNESKTKANAESNQLTRNEAAQVITANAHAIQSNYDDIYAVRGQARSNTTQIANNAQDIHQNRVDINKNTADIKDLRSDLEEQAKQTAGIGAMAMATSNLVMPYSVGKFSVTAGVGNYDSESEIAVGSGYRFDEHLTVRANAAYETGAENVGIGAGVGYEF
ncbi:YadA C-terminal domain-containing protein [Vibrio crassostreae]|uniref:YadA C-terminal domain-containing protein n=1 Tax=Vibrio crassostreae TaxID=246167 RepID=UPI000FAE8744|nr:YadA C-terminal domain-containing protein [Vibrio crassostreae]ROO69162.1 YadA-like protein [Vibrio crassostreae]RPF57326.1 YadA-like protein [Vibrio crassostreae]CAK2527567.1 YadA-like protein [Vibrio crassostreae]CAK3401025.1 YadA-like protein [Vibrio crassostreae]CAK3457240.1 YadA-like protein [Vibrio crassostreae]